MHFYFLHLQNQNALLFLFYTRLGWNNKTLQTFEQNKNLIEFEKCFTRIFENSIPAQVLKLCS